MQARTRDSHGRARYAGIFGGRSAAWVTLAMALLLFGGQATAQTWLPEKGTWTASLLFADVLNREHWTTQGDRVDVGHTRSQSYGLIATYSPTDRLMFSAGIPYVRTRYWGPPSHGGDPHVEDDDGHWHDDFTDWRFSAHYTLLEDPFVLTPLVAVVLPSNDYTTLGHASHGRQLNEYWLGFGIGKNLSEWLPRTFIQARYTYAIVEHVQHVSHDRVNLNLEIGTFLTRRLSVSAYGSWQDTLGGIDLPVPPSSPYFLNHDRIGNDDFFNAGVGAGFAITPDLNLYVNYMQGVSGRNGHVLNQGTTIGLSYGFNPRLASGAAHDF
jgi:hypothetical protein